MRRHIGKTIASLAYLAVAIMVADPARSAWGHGHGFHGGHHLGHGFGHHGGHHLGHGFGHHGSHHFFGHGFGHHAGHYLGYYGYAPYAYYSPYGYGYDQPYDYGYYPHEPESHVHGYTFYPSYSSAPPVRDSEPYESDPITPAGAPADEQEMEAAPRNDRTPVSDAAKRHLDDHGASASAAGWELLSQDRPTEALREFAIQATRHPTEGVPKFGYALTSAALGDLDRGTWAMRRAFRIDPKAVHHVELDAALQRTVRHLVARYQDQLTRGDRNGDVSFTLAALYDLLHDVERARNLLAVAIARGDGSASATNLHMIFEREYPRAISGGGSEQAKDDSSG